MQIDESIPVSSDSVKLIGASAEDDSRPISVVNREGL